MHSDPHCPLPICPPWPLTWFLARVRAHTPIACTQGTRRPAPCIHTYCIWYISILTWLFTHSWCSNKQKARPNVALYFVHQKIWLLHIVTLVLLYNFAVNLWSPCCASRVVLKSVVSRWNMKHCWVTLCLGFFLWEVVKCLIWQFCELLIMWATAFKTDLSSIQHTVRGKCKASLRSSDQSHHDFLDSNQYFFGL